MFSGSAMLEEEVAAGSGVEEVWTGDWGWGASGREEEDSVEEDSAASRAVAC